MCDFCTDLKNLISTSSSSFNSTNYNIPILFSTNPFEEVSNNTVAYPFVFIPSGSNISLSGNNIIAIDSNPNFLPIINYPNVFNNTYTNIPNAKVTQDDSGITSIYLPVGKYIVDIDLSIVNSRYVTFGNTYQANPIFEISLVGGTETVMDESIDINPPTQKYYGPYIYNWKFIGRDTKIFPFMIQPSFFFELTEPSYIALKTSLSGVGIKLYTSLSGIINVDASILSFLYSSININKII